jgi:hypothetical protein
MLAWRQDGRTPDDQGAPQPILEKSQSSTRDALNSYKGIQGSNRERNGHPSGLIPSGLTIVE